MAAKRSRSKTALRGAVNNIIMESLYSGEKYGYEIIKEVEEKTNGKIKLKQPSLYSSLKRFETKGYIESHWQDSDIGGKRHYYKLTPSGLTYYKKNVAKSYDDDYEEDDEVQEIINNSNEEFLEDQILAEYEIDEHEESTDLTKYEYNVDDKVNSLLSITPETKEDLLDELYQEIEEDTVYDEDDITNEHVQEEIPDHEFRTPTPITEVVNNKDNDVTDNALNDIIVNQEENDNVFADIKIDVSNDTSQPVEPVKIIVDSDGITKMYYEGEDHKKPSNKVFDNVVYRTATQDIYSTLNNKKHEKEEILTDEEKELRSKRFFEKFDSKSEQIMKEKQLARASQPQKPDPIDNSPIDYSYKSKLNNLFDKMGGNDNEDDDIENINSYDVSYDIEDDEFATLPSFDSKDENDQSLYDDEEIITSATPIAEKDQDYTMRLYTEEKTKNITKKYLQVNKAKFSFGLVMLLFMLVQVTTMLIIFKNQNLLMDNQFWVFQLSYVIVGIVALIYCVPVFISPNKQASNSFKLGYSLMFGCLAFFIVVILTYAINTFIGMELFNLKYYLATLLVPIILSLNFVFGPLIYWVITQNKSLY